MAKVNVIAASEMREESLRQRLRSENWKRAKQMRLLYLMFLLPLVIFFLFHYLPMSGLWRSTVM